MIETRKDSLLLFGRMLSTLLQGLCGLAGAAVLLLIPVVLLISNDMLPGFGGANGSETIKASPLLVIAVFTMLALILVALFYFFGKLRAIILSVSEGDPFTPENAKRINAMAWLFLGVKILALLIGGLRLTLANLLNKDPNGRDSLDFSLYDLDGILIVVVLFILARIFGERAIDGVERPDFFAGLEIDGVKVAIG